VCQVIKRIETKVIKRIETMRAAIVEVR